MINNVIIFRFLSLIYARNNLILDILSNIYFYKITLYNINFQFIKIF